MPTPGYWIECSRQKISLPANHTIWDESDSEHEDIRGGNTSDAYLERECSDLYEDDEDSEATPRYLRRIFFFTGFFLEFFFSIHALLLF